MLSKKHRHANHAHALIRIERRQASGLGSQHSDVVPTRQLARQGGHNDAAAAAQRRIFVITEQDPQTGLVLRGPSSFFALVHIIAPRGAMPSGGSATLLYTTGAASGVCH